jgi:carbonic anhydrase
MREILATGKAHLHALWFDIYTGDIYYFSRQKKRFVDVNETSFSPILEEILSYYT